MTNQINNINITVLNGKAAVDPTPHAILFRKDQTRTSKN